MVFINKLETFEGVKVGMGTYAVGTLSYKRTNNGDTFHIQHYGRTIITAHLSEINVSDSFFEDAESLSSTLDGLFFANS